MSEYERHRIQKLELDLLEAQAEIRRLENSLMNAAVAHYVPRSDELDHEVKAALQQLAATERLAEWS